LLREQIEGSAAAKRMLSALLIGFNVEVPEGKLVGGTLAKTPLCTRRARPAASSPTSLTGRPIPRRPAHFWGAPLDPA
jgi:hypothetical protein